MGLFKPIPGLLLSDYSINSNQPNGPQVEIIGFKPGFFNWLLDLIKFKSRKIVFQFYEDYILTISGDKLFQKSSIRDVYSASIGYTSKKLLIVISTLLYLLGILHAILIGQEGEYYHAIYWGFIDYYEINEIWIWSPAFILVLIGIIFLWLYSRSKSILISITTSLKNNVGIRVRSGYTGKKIAIDDMLTIKQVIFQTIDKGSRFYNGYYYVELPMTKPAQGSASEDKSIEKSISFKEWKKSNPEGSWNDWRSETGQTGDV